MKRSVQLGIVALVLCGAGVAAVGAAGASDGVAGDSIALTNAGNQPAAAQADSPTVTLVPQSESLRSGGSYKVDVVVTGIDGTVGAYDLNITASGEASVVFEGYEAASDSGNAEVITGPFGEVVDIVEFGAGLNATNGTVMLGTLKVTPEATGSATLDPAVRSLTDESGTEYNVTSEPRNLTVVDGIPPLPGNANPPQNVDSDPQLEDIDGNGEANLFDAIELYNLRNSDVVQRNIDLFDFTEDGSVDLFDAIELYNEIAG